VASRSLEVNNNASRPLYLPPFICPYTNARLLDTVSVTTLGTGVDGTVLSIKRSYDNLNRLQNVTSYGSTGGTGTVVNDIQYAYNDFGDATTSYQSHSGTVNTMSTPSVQYAYDTTTTSSVFSSQHRLQTVTYPNSRVVFYGYNASSANDPYHRLSKIREIRDTNSSGTQFAVYDYNGAGSRLAIANLPQPSFQLDYFHAYSAINTRSNQEELQAQLKKCERDHDKCLRRCKKK
jgi:hypothetical protein